MRSFAVLATLAAVVLVAVVAAPASAESTLPTYGVSGVETSIPTGNTSTFAGTAFSLTAGFALWQASVEHQSLAWCTAHPTDDTCIYGGSFSLGRTSGAFESGTISLVSGNPGSCTSTVVFDVDGEVALTGGDTASFHVRLTHYETRLLGTCVPYFATVAGTFGPA
jgi:hypothetical protein